MINTLLSSLNFVNEIPSNTVLIISRPLYLAPQPMVVALLMSRTITPSGSMSISLNGMVRLNFRRKWVQNAEADMRL